MAGAVGSSTFSEPTFVAGGGEMGALIRAFDWSKTPIGPVESWSPALRMMVSFMLANRFPLLLWWGPQYASIYNDAYRPILGTKHPMSMGQPVSECWSEIWHILQPLIDGPFQGGAATWMEDLEVEIRRSGFFEETHFTVAYSPVPDETAPRGIGGVLATVHEITEKIIGERRITALRDLSARAAEAETAEEACAAAVATLANDPKDIPFALLYLIEGDASQARLAGAAGILAGLEISPAVVDLKKATGAWPLAEAVRNRDLIFVEDLAARFAEVPRGPWSDPPCSAVVVPVRSNKTNELAALLVAGISARLRLDDAYRGFLELVAAQIATAVANARAYEEERRRAEALAEIDRAKTTFFSNVSHEFRTPLTLMLGPLEDLLAAPRESLPQRREDLALVHRNGLRLLRLVNTLLDFSRIEAGRVQASYEPVDLSSLTADLASAFRAAIERTGLRLTVECAPLAEPVWVDRDMWEKIVLNLVSNAFKFTFEGEISVRVQQQDRSAVLQIRDTGTGIPAAEIPRLFDRFHRVDGARGRTHEGTGIGLALVQELARLHGGTVDVESVYGVGSTFSVTIPLGSAHLPADRLRAAPALASTALGAQPYIAEALRWLLEDSDQDAAEPGIEMPILGEPGTMPSDVEQKHATILFADDNADMRDYVRRLLGGRYEIRTVADGVAALAELEARRPDLLLSDVMMPGLDGIGLVRRVRDDLALANLPIILLSARAGEEAGVEGIEAGADDYLVKPFSARELVARVRANLEMARLRREAEERIATDLDAMTRLREVGDRCVRMGDHFEECLHQILDAAIAITGADKGTLQLFDAKTGAIEIAVQRGFETPFVDFFARVFVGEATVCGVALRSGERVIVGDVARSEIFAGRAALDIMLAADARAVQSTPLVSSAGTVCGMISTHFSRPHRPSERDLRFMDLLAHQAAHYLERRKAEEAAQALAAELQQILDTAATGLTHCSRELRYVSANPAFANIAGLPLDQIVGRPIAEVMGEAGFAVIRPYVDRVLRGERTEYEAELTWAARGPRWNHMVYTPCRDANGRVNGWVASVRDVTERKRAEHSLRNMNETLERQVAERTRALEGEMAERRKVEEMLQQSQRLEAIGRLTGGVAHDFNNLLTVIVGQAEGIIAIAERDERLKQMALAVRRAAERGAQLTGQLLSFSRRQRLQPAATSLQNLILGIGELVRRAVGETIAVRIATTPELWAAHLDPARFESAILNLAINARDAMPNGGRLDIIADNATLAVAEAARLDLDPGKYIVVRVADTGHGMAPEIQRRAFEPFFTTKDVGQGTGLGLAQIYGFAKQSGGTATIESAVRTGTTVSLYLPKAADGPAAGVRAGEPGAPMRGHGRTILVVEDQPEVCEVIESFLDGLDFRVLTAPDGRAARTLLESDETIDLLLTDVVMPNGVSGLELARDARRLRQDLKIVAISGYLRPTDASIADLAGLTFLEKPFRRTELVQTIAAALGEAGADAVVRSQTTNKKRTNR